MPERKVVIIAGPNGAGKTTFAREFLPREAGLPHFINADLIAAGLSPFEPERAAVRAGRIMLQEISDDGYVVSLVFLKLASVDEALRRVAHRVQHGGHNVPADVVRRRFVAGWNHFDQVYRHKVSYWRCFDNSGPSPVFLNEGVNP
jgi:predicted ABC-type ATPase